MCMYIHINKAMAKKAYVCVSMYVRMCVCIHVCVSMYGGCLFCHCHGIFSFEAIKYLSLCHFEHIRFA